MSPFEPNLSSGHRITPGQAIHAQPWGFVALALMAGITTGLLLRAGAVRKVLGMYLSVRRMI